MSQICRTVAVVMVASVVSLTTSVARDRTPRVSPAVGSARDLVYRIPDRELIPERTALTHTAGQVTDWGHDAIGVPMAWATTRGKGAVVAVLDTGIDATHTDLRGRVRSAFDFTGTGSTHDIPGHGTFCAGVIAAADNGVGVVGVAPEADLLCGKVLGDTGAGLSGWIAAGIDWAVAEGADVISLSVGSPVADPRLGDAVRRAAARGVIVVAAAGNAGPGANTVEFPGGFPEVVCVAAVDEKRYVAEFSSRGPEVDVAAPGVAVHGPYPGDRVAVLSGTSMATPYVAGVAALYVANQRATGRTSSPAEFRRRIEATSVSRNPQRPNPNSGWGLIRADGVVGRATNRPPLDRRLVLSETDFTPDAWKRLRVASPGLRRITFEFDTREPKPERRSRVRW